MNKTICFATMCKNEEHCIKETLESVYKYIDTWVVCDTGSTDKTCEIVKDFFKEKKISGKLFIDEWKGFDHNKTLLFNRCFNKSDYILHLDADDLLVGNFEFKPKVIKDSYYITTKRGSLNYKCLILFNNRLHWKFCGVAHTTIKSIERDYSNSEELVCNNIYLHSRDTGSRSFDKDKYYNDALKLQKQFYDTLYDDPDDLNNRSVFYTAQSYMDALKNKEALQWYKLYLKLKDGWIEEEFECNLKIMELLIKLEKSYDEIKKYFNNSILLYEDRAEPYYILGKYCNDIKKNSEAYDLLKKAKTKNYQNAINKYTLFVRHKCYGKFINDELSVACYWTDRYIEGLNLLKEILHDSDFEIDKERLLDNENHFNNKLK